MTIETFLKDIVLPCLWMVSLAIAMYIYHRIEVRNSRLESYADRSLPAIALFSCLTGIALIWFGTELMSGLKHTGVTVGLFYVNRLMLLGFALVAITTWLHDSAPPPVIKRSDNSGR